MMVGLGKMKGGSTRDCGGVYWLGETREQEIGSTRGAGDIIIRERGGVEVLGVRGH